MKKIYAIVISLISVCSYSQEVVKSLDLGISKNAEVFQVVEKDRKQVSLFFSARINVLAVRLDENFNVIDSLKTKRPSRDEYDDIVGYSVSGNKYYAYWSSSNGKQMIAQGFDFDAKKTTSTTISIPLEKEKIIQKITVNNVFYIISIIKNTGVLNFYVLKDGVLERKSVDLSDKTFENKMDRTTNLWDIVSSTTDYQSSYSFQTIATETPPSLALSAYKHKVYVLDNKLLFTLDDNSRFTQTFTIDLSDFSTTTKVFAQPVFKGGDIHSYESNSFLLDGKIIQMKNNSDLMKITVKDMEDHPIKEFLINDQEISFKNSDINQENGSPKSFRVLDKSSQLLRKIKGNNAAISLYENNGKIYMIVGGVSNIQQSSGGPMMYGGMGMAGGFTGVMIGMALTSNYSLNNLNSYKQRKVVYINCLFDKEFNHVPGEVKKTSFDNVRVFAETHDNLIAPVLFRMDSNLYYGGADNGDGKYSFYKFSD
jgi:hypothetical protein